MTNSKIWRPADQEQYTYHEAVQSRVIIPKDLLLTQMIENDGSGRAIYIGLAIPGTATSAAKWLIKQINYDGNGFTVSILFADSSTDFNKVWDDRVGYDYA